jgi:hypothetical protein
MHLGMNMLSTAAISSLLEKRFGTLRQIVSILWSILLTSVVYTIVALLLSALLGMDDLMYQHSVGFSGVIFHLSVLESGTTSSTRSVFGVISVPAPLYPWALLVALSVIMPQVSFMGHLAGILTGTLELYGFLDGIIVGNDYLQEIETWSALRPIVSRPNFVYMPLEISGSQIRDPAALRRSIGRGCGVICKLIKRAMGTLQTFILGSGGDLNQNIQLGIPRGNLDGSGALGAGDVLLLGESDDDSDDWVGLPPMSSITQVDSRVL